MYKRITITLDENIYKSLREIAEANDRDTAQQVAYYIRKGLSNEIPINSPINEILINIYDILRKIYDDMPTYNLIENK
jgi:hypothetical protein